MRISGRSNELLAQFFSEKGVCTPDQYPGASVFCKTGAKLFTAIIGADGVTLGRWIFVNPRHVGKNKAHQPALSRNLLAHEMVHVVQYQKLGFFGFLTKYVSDFWKEFKVKDKWTAATWYEAYLAIPFETEARDLAKSFELWSKNQQD